MGLEEIYLSGSRTSTIKRLADQSRSIIRRGTEGGRSPDGGASLPRRTTRRNKYVFADSVLIVCVKIYIIIRIASEIVILSDERWEFQFGRFQNKECFYDVT
jgi:hypothetical protein